VIEVKKKDGESNESVIRRFIRKVQSSGRLILVKKKQFHNKTKNKQLVRLEAIRRSKNQTEREFLKKIGKLEEFEGRFGYQRNKSKVKINNNASAAKKN